MESGRIAAEAPDELDLAATLRSGQVFRWRVDPDGAWRGTIGRRRVRLAQDADGALLYQADGPDAHGAIRQFLRLDDLLLAPTARRWARDDSRFARAWEAQPGVRVLRQARTECFFSFLCASVAPIKRIAAMLDAVATEAGEDLGEGFVAFPDPERLVRVPESRLRELGLGFRAARVAAAARRLSTDPTLLDTLPTGDLDAARQTLCAFSGVGPKIADCIALFSVDTDHAVPVDTHIWRLARTQYAPELAGKSLTAANYARAAQAFQDRFGPHAGWAQQILFYQAAHKE